MKKYILLLNFALALVIIACAPKPGDAYEYESRGDEYYAKKNYNRAIADYNAAIRLRPTVGSFYNSRAIAYHAKKDYDSAITDFTEAIQLTSAETSKGVYYYNRAAAYYDKGDYTLARTDINRALRIRPNDKDAKDLDADLKRRGY